MRLIIALVMKRINESQFYYLLQYININYEVDIYISIQLNFRRVNKNFFEISFNSDLINRSKFSFQNYSARQGNKGNRIYSVEINFRDK